MWGSSHCLYLQVEMSLSLLYRWRLSLLLCRWRSSVFLYHPGGDQLIVFIINLRIKSSYLLYRWRSSHLLCRWRSSVFLCHPDGVIIFIINVVIRSLSLLYRWRSSHCLLFIIQMEIIIALTIHAEIRSFFGFIHFLIDLNLIYWNLELKHFVISIVITSINIAFIIVVDVVNCHCHNHTFTPIIFQVWR